MAERIRVGDRLPFFCMIRPTARATASATCWTRRPPLVLVFMANFGHPITRTFASRYARYIHVAARRRLCAGRRAPARDKLARSIGPDTLPYPLLCDAAGVLYEHLSIPTSKSTLMSYSLEGWRILREAEKQGYQPVKGAEQQLPLTLILDRDGTVLFCHYGASLTDAPEDCAAIQSLLEEMELTPGLEPEEDELPYEELQTAWGRRKPPPQPPRARTAGDNRRIQAHPPRCMPTRNRIWKKHRCLVCLMTPMTINEKVPAGSKNGRHFCLLLCGDAGQIFCLPALTALRRPWRRARRRRRSAGYAIRRTRAGPWGHPRGGRSYRFPAAFCSWHGTPAPRAGPRAARR